MLMLLFLQLKCVVGLGFTPAPVLPVRPAPTPVAPVPSAPGGSPEYDRTVQDILALLNKPADGDINTQEKR